jgi:hypothetical protein
MKMMPNQILGMLQQFKSNPMQMLMQKRMNLPQNVPMNDPNAILNHLLQTGQISQQQINNAYQMAQQFKR